MGDLPLLRIDAQAHRAWAGDRELKLPLLQWKVLVLLASTPGEVVPFGDLLQAWPPERPGTRASLQTHIKELRRALGDDTRPYRYISTVHGVGFRLEAALLAPGSVLTWPPAMPAQVDAGDLMEAFDELRERVARLEHENAALSTRVDLHSAALNQASTSRRGALNG